MSPKTDKIPYMGTEQFREFSVRQKMATNGRHDSKNRISVAILC
jgi:hypothetical protein